MLSGNLSSTAMSLLNLTNTTGNLEAAEAPNHAARNFIIAAVSVLAMAIFCLRQPTPLSVLMNYFASRNRSTPKIYNESTPLISETGVPNNGVNSFAANKLTKLTEIRPESLEMAALVDLLQTKEFDPADLVLTIPTSNKPRI
jgi:hypothetical protein